MPSVTLPDSYVRMYRTYSKMKKEEDMRGSSDCEGINKD